MLWTQFFVLTRLKKNRNTKKYNIVEAFESFFPLIKYFSDSELCLLFRLYICLCCYLGRAGLILIQLWFFSWWQGQTDFSRGDKVRLAKCICLSDEKKQIVSSMLLKFLKTSALNIVLQNYVFIFIWWFSEP